MYRKGDILIDKEQSSEVVVIRLESSRADEVLIDENHSSRTGDSRRSVYEYNVECKGYEYVQPDEPVVYAVYSESLPANPMELTKEGRGIILKNADVPTYYLPTSRVILPEKYE
jgi:hypothetical protein